MGGTENSVFMFVEFIRLRTRWGEVESASGWGGWLEWVSLVCKKAKRVVGKWMGVVRWITKVRLSNMGMVNGSVWLRLECS